MDTLAWLQDGADPSLLFQVKRDLLGEGEASWKKVQARVAGEGHGKALLGQRKPDGHWGKGAYNPKWTCTNYALSELVQLGLAPGNKDCKESSLLILSHPRGRDGGVNFAKTVEYSDVCVNGMVLNYASYFGCGEEFLGALVDYLLDVRMEDGGWNCEYYHGAVHSSLHTTISVLEGIAGYLDRGHRHKEKELAKARDAGIEFILKHELFKTSTTGETIKDEFFTFSFPVRWKYDILRCLDFFRSIELPYDPRMEAALGKVEVARGKDSRWKSRVQAGKTYFDVDTPGAPGKWNTLRAMRVLKAYGRGS